MTVEEAKDMGRKVYALSVRDTVVSEQLNRDFWLSLSGEPEDMIVVLVDAFDAGMDEARACDLGGVR